MLKKIEEKFVWFWSNPRCVFWFGMLITLIATSLEVFRGRNTNYFDYQDSTRMFWEGLSPYTLEYAQAHCIYFLYSPVFSVIFAPIFLLPWWLGPYVWNICNFSLYALAIKTLPERFDRYKHWIFLFMLPVLLQAIFCYQHNTIVAYIFIFAYSLLERNKGFWAVLLIMLSATTKVYGAAELAMLLCYPKMWRNFGYAAICGIGLLCLPLLNHNFDNPFILYQQMFDMIADHHSDSDFIGLLFARGLKPFILPNYREVQMSVLGLLAIGFFWRYKRWTSPLFRVRALAVLSGFMILFSDCPETHTYIIALGPYAMAFWKNTDRRWYDWLLFWLLVFNFGIIPTDILCPAWLHDWIHQMLWLDVYTMFFCWLRVLWLAIKPEPCDKPIGKGIAVTIAIILVACLVINWNRTYTPVSENAAATEPAVIEGMKSAEDNEDGSHISQKTFTVGGVTFHMNLVEGGSFLMGNPSPKDVTEEDEHPVHKVTLKSYYIGETEVTQALWSALMPKNRSKHKGDNLPVEYVTYAMAHEFIDSLNAKTHQHFRLPSEAEWEYAACGGRYSKGYLYAGSDNINEVAHTLQNNPRGNYPEVATLKPNELGLYDMSGNVWEWCEDAYRHYDGTHQSTNFHVIRGGGYDCSPQMCRSSNRFMYDNRRRRDLVGFRLALTL